jgi:neopullulanase
LERWDSPPRLWIERGDLPGIVEHLDHLVDLGVTPFSKSHLHLRFHPRYHTYDYFNVDPLLGGNEAFRNYLPTHARGLNPTGRSVQPRSRGFLQFNHTLESGSDLPIRDWSISATNNCSARSPF